MVQGNCEEGFEPVKDMFQHMFQHGSTETFGQLCVYVGKQCVVDLWASAAGDPTYTADKIQTVFSSGKSLSAIVVALLVDRGQLDYDSKVSQYWPEFGQGGKEQVTLADVLRHESGLAWINHTFKADDFLPHNIKANAVGKVLEVEPAHWPDQPAGLKRVPTKREYHSVTRGIILNEIVRRADPQGRTIGEIIREDINVDGVRVGLTDEELSLVAHEQTPSLKYVLGQSILPGWAGRRIDLNFFDLARLNQRVKRKRAEQGVRPLFMENMPRDHNGLSDFFDSKPIKMAEMPSANAQCSARGLAKLAAMMAHKGEAQDGQRLLSEETWMKMHDKTKRAYDYAMSDNRSNFAQGGVNSFTTDEDSTEDEKKLVKGRHGYVGWLGLGGSAFMWEPKLKVGFAFVPTNLHWFDLVNQRAARLQELVLQCAASQQQQ